MAFGSPLTSAAEPGQSIARVGFVGPGSPNDGTRTVSAFWERLRQLGWIEGQNLIIEARWAEHRYDRLPALIAQVIGRKVDVIVARGTAAGIAAKNATGTIPIVVAPMGDPIGTELAPSLARPGGNLTGVSLGWSEGIVGKWLELLQETVRRLTTLAVIANPDQGISREQLKRLERIAPTRGISIRIIEARGPEALDRAFEQAKARAQAVLVIDDPYMLPLREKIAMLAVKHRLPDMHVVREFVDAGGLMAYGPELPVIFQRAAEYVDKILRGAKPADLPIEQPTKFQLVVNLKTARALGLNIPESILLRADEVIR